MLAVTDRLIKDWPACILICVWLAGNLILFSVTFWKYYADPEFHYLFSILGMTVAISRGAAAALNLNLGLVILPVCRNLVSSCRGWIENSRKQCTQITMVNRQLDKNIYFHKLCAYAICFWSALHLLGHLFNFERYTHAATLPTDPQEMLITDLSRLSFQSNMSWINPIRTNNTNSMVELITCLPGLTGVIATMILIAIVASSTDFVRRHSFEVFWYTHHLFIVMYGLLIFHGFGGIIRGQLNLDQHDVHRCTNVSNKWGAIEECPLPEFYSPKSETWMWVIGPVLVYSVECIIRIVNRCRVVEIIQVTSHQSNVMELRMRKRHFQMKAGQYIFLNCPSISKFEWHPFTLTSAPEDDFFSVHMRVAGDWTKSFARLCNSGSYAELQMPRIHVDGPYGSCSGVSYNIFRYKTVMMIAAGIGVTPFVSLLKHIWNRFTNTTERVGMTERVYFHWVCSDPRGFEWLFKTLHSLEGKTRKHGSDRFLHIHIHWTKGWTEDDMELIVTSTRNKKDPITNLESKTNFGRPDWRRLFKRNAILHKNEQIGVFFCGPRTMSSDLRRMCRKYSSRNPNKTQFVFNKETC